MSSYPPTATTKPRRRRRRERARGSRRTGTTADDADGDRARATRGRRRRRARESSTRTRCTRRRPPDDAASAAGRWRPRLDGRGASTTSAPCVAPCRDFCVFARRRRGRRIIWVFRGSNLLIAHSPAPGRLHRDVHRRRRPVAGAPRCHPREAPPGGEDEGERRGGLRPIYWYARSKQDLVRVVEGAARVRVRSAVRRRRAAGGDERPGRGDPREHPRARAARRVGARGEEALEQRADAATLRAQARVVAAIHGARVHVRGSLGRGARPGHARHHRRGRHRRADRATRRAHLNLCQAREVRHEPRQAPHVLRAVRQQQGTPFRLPRPSSDRAGDARDRRTRRQR